MSIKRNGSYANGRQRWYCHDCRRSFCWSNPGRKLDQEKIWFERWMAEGYSVRQLSAQSGHSPNKLRQIIDHWLALEPVDTLGSLGGFSHLIFDGTFLHRPTSIACLMDAASHTVIRGRLGVHENSEPQLLGFLKPLKKRGLKPVSVTTDGSPQVIRVFRRLWPEILPQRCLVHIQRQGLVWCRQYPRRPDARALRRIFLDVMSIDTKEKQKLFLDHVRLWEEQHGVLIAARPERGRVFSDLKRARSMLLNALPNMFYYLDDPCIPKSTNGIEGYFARLKAHYRSHRGLDPGKRQNYFSWYFKLRPR